MENGSIVITALPQADGQVKNRPALLLCRVPPFDDWLLCGISTQLHHAVSDADEVLRDTDSDFAATGLLRSSVIRTRYLATIPASSIKGRIGSLSLDRMQRIYQSLAAQFQRLATR